MKVALAGASTLVIALMMAMPVSAGAKTVLVTDRSGDLGHPLFVRVVDGMINPADFWNDNSPVGKATYLDVLRAWMTADMKADTYAAGMTVASSIPTTGPLPDGIVEIWWVWWFYLDTESWPADYRLVVSWDGTSSYAYLMNASTHSGDTYPFTMICSYEISDVTVTASVDQALVWSSVAWFYEVIVWNAKPVGTSDKMPGGGWYAADMTDSPADTLLPWWPLP